MPYYKLSLQILLLLLVTGCGSGLCPLRNGTDACISGSFFGIIGVLDTSFNGTGIATTPIGASHDQGFSLAVQSDGKILLGGSYFTGANNDFAIARFHSNGSLDTTFNGTGFTTTPIGASNDDGRSLAIQSDGKILLGGYVQMANPDFAVARFHSNGSLDTTFNGTGYVTTSLAINDYGYSLAVQPDGKILIGGGSNNDFAIVRYHSNGSLDTTFNGTGSVTTNIGAIEEAYSLVLQSDGKILLGGISFNGANFDLAVLRYHSNGSLDTTFNGTGTVTTPIGAGQDTGMSLAVQSDGKILLGGYAVIANNDFIVTRYNTDGSLDTTFNGTGKVTTPIGSGSDLGSSLALQADGKIVLGGQYLNVLDDDFALIRYHSNGSLDTTFNATGIVRTPIGSGYDTANSLVIQPDGKILLGGNYDNGVNQDFVIARYR